MAKKGTGTTVPADREDEADIVESLGGEVDEEGNVIVSEDKIREIGAVDAESVRVNNRMSDFARRRRANEKGVVFSGPLLERYENLLQIAPPNTLDISMMRRTGTPATFHITTCPKNSGELLKAIEDKHGIHEEAEYEISCLNTVTRQWAIKNARITMPDTRPPAQQGQPPMHYSQSPQAVPQQPGQPPQVFVQPATGPDPMALVRSILELVQAQQPPAPAATPAQPIADPMLIASQIIELVRSAGGGASPQQPMTPQQAVDPVAIARQIVDATRPRGAPPSPHSNTPTPPTANPPAGYMWAWFADANCFALVPDTRSAAPRGGHGPNDGNPNPFARPPYYPQGADRRPPPGPPPRERTPADQLRESLNFVRQAVEAAQEMNAIFPNQGGAPESAQPVDDDDDSPVKVIETGRGKVIVGREDGTFRPWETFSANLPDILKWAGDEFEKARRSRAEPKRQLPPNHVEAGPDYQPPPGFKAVPVDENDLPPPPENIPPPINPAPTRRPWAVPPIEE